MMTNTTTHAPAQRERGRHSVLRRSLQVAEVLARYELWHILDLLDLDHLVPGHRAGHDPARALEPEPVRLRKALVELGPTFIKFGQLLSTRQDLLPPEYQLELAKLQDQAPTLSFEAVHATVSAELGKPPDDAFVAFDRTPLAAASLGQAHAATLEDGTEVVVKVRRPGVVEQIDVDLKLLRRLATIAHSRSDTARRWDLLGLCTEFETLLRAELDYVTEARNAERFARNFGQPMSTVRIPRIFWNSTTTEVLTLERMHGLRGTDVAGLDAAGIDRSHLAEQTADMVVKMLLVDRFFHADLHPGNLFVQPDGRIALIDFGEVGTLDEPTHAALAQIVLALIQQDPERLTSAIVALQPTSDAADHHALMQDVKVLLGLTGADAAAGKHRRQFGAVINEVLTIMRRHRLVLPSSMALVLKTLAMLESIAEQLDPSFEFMDVFLPYARQFMLDYYSPRRLIERARKTAADVWWISTELPGHVRQLISSLEDGSFKMIVQPSGMEALVVRAERLIDRLVLGIIVAALINGGAVLLSASQQPGAAQAVGALLNIGAFAVLGLGLALTWGMVRSVGRR